MDDTYLKKTTVFPGQSIYGFALVQQTKDFSVGTAQCLGTRNYEFQFPPPVTAKAPTAPGIPAAGTVASATVPIPTGAIDKESGSVGSPRNGAKVLGIVGATFEQGDVEIVDIDPDGCAALAGLKIGDIINSVDGKRVRSMPALAGGVGEPPTRFDIADWLYVSKSVFWLDGGSR